MTARYKVLKPEDLTNTHGVRPFAMDVLNGLSETPKHLPSRWIYDEAGSMLFKDICDLDEYYQTRTEAAILEAHADAILNATGEGPLAIVDLGAGDGRKTNILLDAVAGRDTRFVPIDISESAMVELCDNTAKRFPKLQVNGLVSDYFDGIQWLSGQSKRRKLVLFLGSNIGNFSVVQARNFLRQLWDSLDDGDIVLMGFDMKKDIELLLAAYNDREGVTAKFSLNLLSRINNELGANFDTSAFRHFATYNVFSGAMESYLVSLKEQDVYVGHLKQSFHFDSWEPIHTEYSYKYLDSDISKLAKQTGFEMMEQFTDGKKWFTDSLWRV
ncbi:MAG: L-histidine N(alpha)-methyltransferase, partial [Planctomycetota bacterium]